MKKRRSTTSSNRQPQIKTTVSPELMELADLAAEILGLNRSDMCRGFIVRGIIDTVGAFRWAPLGGLPVGPGHAGAHRKAPDPDQCTLLADLCTTDVAPHGGPSGGPLAPARDPEEERRSDPPCSPPAAPSRQDAEQLQALTRELSEIFNTQLGTVLDTEDPNARATISMRLAGLAPDGRPATPEELREVARGISMIYEPHHVTLRGIYGPKYPEHRQRALAALKNPARTKPAPRTEGERRAAARRRRR